MRQFIAISPEGKEYTSNSQSEFAKEHNLKQSNIAACLKGKRKNHRGWTFRYNDNVEEVHITGMFKPHINYNTTYEPVAELTVGFVDIIK